MREADRVEGFAERADLVELDEDRVGRALVDTALQALDIRHEEVVAHELDAIARALVERRPAGPVVLGHAVLDRDDRVGGDPVRPERGEPGAVERAALAREDIAAAFALALVELGHGRIEGDRDLVAGDAAGGRDGLHQQLQRLAVRAELRCEAALVADGRAVAARREDVAQRVVDLGGPAQALAETAGAERDDHELLEVGRAGGVGAAVEHVGHRHRQQWRRVPVEAAEVAEQGQTACGRGGVGRRERDAEDRVRPEDALVGAAVGGNQRLVDGALVGGVNAAYRLGERPVGVGDRPRDAAPAIAVRVAVAQFDGLVGAGAGSAGDDRPPARAAGEEDDGLDGGVAAGVEQLKRLDVRDRQRCRIGWLAGAHAVPLVWAISGRAGGPARRPRAGGCRRAGCRSAWLRRWRGRATPARHGRRRRRAAYAWRRSGAACAA